MSLSVYNVLKSVLKFYLLQISKISIYTLEANVKKKKIFIQGSLAIYLGN